MKLKKKIDFVYRGNNLSEDLIIISAKLKGSLDKKGKMKKNKVI